MMLISESTKVDVKGTPKVISAFVVLVFGLLVLFNWILHDVKLAISQISGYLAFCTFNFKIIVLSVRVCCDTAEAVSIPDGLPLIVLFRF